MKQKTFNFGEVVLGGTIRVILKRDIEIEFCKYKTKTIVSKRVIKPWCVGDVHKYLNENATSFCADKVYKWIAENRQHLD